MENWRQYVAEVEQEEEPLEEGFIGKTIAGLAIVAAGFLGSPAEAAENDVIFAVPQHAGAGADLDTGSELKLQDAFQTAFFKHLKGTGLKAHSRDTISQVGDIGAAEAGASDISQFAANLNSNVVTIQYDRTKEGLDVFVSVIDHDGNLIEKESLQIPNDEKESWRVIDNAVGPLADSVVDTLTKHPSPPEAAAEAEPAVASGWTGQQTN